VPFCVWFPSSRPRAFCTSQDLYAFTALETPCSNFVVWQRYHDHAMRFAEPSFLLEDSDKSVQLRQLLSVEVSSMIPKTHSYHESVVLSTVVMSKLNTLRQFQSDYS